MKPRNATDNFFDEFEQKGGLYRALADRGLIRQAFEESLRDTLWSRDDYGADPELLAMPIYLVLLSGIVGGPDSAEVRSALRKFSAAFPLFDGMRRGHFFDFVAIDVSNRIVIGFGFGRGERIFAYVSVNGGEFEILDDMHYNRYHFSLGLALFERVRRRLEVLGEHFLEAAELELDDSHEQHEQLSRNVVVACEDLVKCFPRLDPLQLGSGDC